ncbi:MAG: carbohydrate binding domain-containing protein, partial [Planctomycetota bacterium]
MRKTWKDQRGALAVVALLLAVSPAKAAEVFEVVLENPSFENGTKSDGAPLGWSKYGGSGKDQRLEVADDPDGPKALLIADGDPSTEIGVYQRVGLKGGETYQVTAKVRALEGASTSGAYVQLRFLPSNQLVQTGLAATSAGEISEISVKGTAPPDTTHGVIYLYTHRDPTPQVLVTGVSLLGGLPPPPPPPPAPVPPQYDKLKSLHLDIALVEQGKPSAAIVMPASGVYETAASVVQGAIEKQTGVTVPIVSDDSPEAALPVKRNLIVLGNRSTNRTTSALYDLYYCLVDLKYPGPQGYVVRSVHNPFGNGHGVVIVGGSDAAGVDEGAKALAGVLSDAPAAAGNLSIGWTMETKLGKGLKPPTDVRQFETWEASKGYGSVGYFGWCSISKRMAMYYMTGDEFSAREVVRLSFPDEQALGEIDEIDGERIENKHDPLAGFYHYNAHMAILFWDLIEESPVITDEERLKITNAFARQLSHRKNEGVYGLTRPRPNVSSRHGQWSAVSLYCLGRYFNKDYPHPIWAQCIRGGELAFRSLHEHGWVSGESDNLFWYNTGVAPVLTYMALTGDRKPLENGVLAGLLRGQEALISGRVPDWALNSASMGFLNKAAYLTGDGRWITYRERTGVNTDPFRLGQSFWPDDSLQPELPADLVGKWTILRLPRPAWGARRSGLPFDQSFYLGSYRSAADATGDYILLDGFNGASRNPYHTFDVLELRLAGQTVLQG